MVRRGFTLIEMLAVIAILMLVMAISLPVARERLAEARFDAAVRRLDAGMAWARAESQRRGEALRVEARLTGGVMGLFLEPLERAETDARTSGSGAGREGVSGAPQPFADVEQGLVITDRDPSARPREDESGGPGGGAGERPVELVRGPDGGAADAAEPLVVATFLPDGSAMAAGPFYVSGLGRAASLTVNHWTGGVRIRLLDVSAVQERSRVDPADSELPGPSGAETQ